MKRDMDLIRTLLLKLEDFQLVAGTVDSIPYGDDWFKIDGFDLDTIVYNANLLEQAGFIHSPPHSGGMMALGFAGLTWSGHEFLDDIRNPEAWRKTKDAMKKVGGFGLEIAAQVTKQYLKDALKTHLGLTI